MGPGMTSRITCIDRNVYENLTGIIYEWSRLNTTHLIRAYLRRRVADPTSRQVQDLTVDEIIFNI